MKRFPIIILVSLLVVVLSACSVEETSVDKNPLAGKYIEKFSADDLQGNKVTNEIFKENELTVVNIWGTFCKPCI